MTGESDEMKKDILSACLTRREEASENFEKSKT
jgi:hypothetical protein